MMSIADIPTMLRHLLRRAGMPKSKMQARAAPPSVYQGNPRCIGLASGALVAAVVETVRVAVPELEPVMFTGVVEPKLKVGGYWAPAGLDVMAAVSTTLPVKPPLGVTVIVEVFSVVAPGTTVTDVPAMAKLGITTVSFRVFELLAKKSVVPW
jgi:hypothetical protein